MRKIDRKMYSYKIWHRSNSEISESISNGMDSANFCFEGTRYSFDITLYPDGVPLISVWDMRNDCTGILPNLCKWLEENVAKWEDVCFSRKMREIYLEEEWNMRKTG